MVDINYTLRVYYLNSTNYQDYTNSEIGINPTISKSMCSGGFSVGNTATASLAITIPNFPSWDKGCKAELFANGTKVMGDWVIGEIEGAEYRRNKLTCYDLMSKADDNITDFGTTETTIDGAALMSLIAEKIGADVTPDFGTLDIPISDIQSSTMREMLAIIGNFGGCNFAMRGNTLTAIQIDFSGNEIAPIVRTNMSDIISAPFTNVIMSNGKENFVSGDGDINHTLKISSKYATQAQADIVMDDIKDHNYSSFKCEKCLLNSIADIGDTFVPFSNSVDTSYKIMQLQLYFSKAGIYASISADTQKKTLDDEKPSTGGGSELENVTNFSGGTNGDTGIVNLTWVKPSTAQNVIVKRKQSTPFNNVIDDGDIIAVTSGNALQDTLPSLWYPYYYRTLTNAGDLYNGKNNQIMIPAIQRGKYLYNMGDKCTALTGGWGGGNGYVGDNFIGGGATFETTDVLLNCYDDTATQYKIYGIKTTGKVDFTGFTKLCVEFELVNEKVYEPENDVYYQAAINRAMPIYNIADSGLTPATYPYAYATYRGVNFGSNYAYRINANAKKLCYVYANGFTALAAIGAPLAMSYNGLTKAYLNYTQYGYNANFAQPSGQNLTFGDYMGGGYANGTNYVYAVPPSNVSLPSKNRVFIGTRGENDYDYKNLVSKSEFAQKSGVGTYTLECAITDIDNNINPPKSQAYVCIAALDAKIKIKAVWLAA